MSKFSTSNQDQGPGDLPHMLKVNIRCNISLAETSDTTDGNKFCHNCSRTLIDFREMSEVEILDFHKAAAQTPCGIYRRSQVYREQPTVRTQPPSPGLWKPVAVAMIGVLTTNAALQAQTPQDSTPHQYEMMIGEVELEPDTTNVRDEIEEEAIPIQVDSLIKGKVVCKATGEGLIAVNIYLKEDPSVGTATDLEGNFEIKLEEPIDASAVLKFSYIGYADLEIEAGMFSQRVEIIMEASEDEMMIIGQIIGPDKKTGTEVKGWRRFKRLLRFGWMIVLLTSFGTIQAQNCKGRSSVPEETLPLLSMEDSLRSASTVSAIESSTLRACSFCGAKPIIVYCPPRDFTPSHIKGWRRVKSIFRSETD